MDRYFCCDNGWEVLIRPFISLMGMRSGDRGSSEDAQLRGSEQFECYYDSLLFMVEHISSLGYKKYSIVLKDSVSAYRHLFSHIIVSNMFNSSITAFQSLVLNETKLYTTYFFHNKKTQIQLLFELVLWLVKLLTTKKLLNN